MLVRSRIYIPKQSILVLEPNVHSKAKYFGPLPNFHSKAKYFGPWTEFLFQSKVFWSLGQKNIPKQRISKPLGNYSLIPKRLTPWASVSHSPTNIGGRGSLVLTSNLSRLAVTAKVSRSSILGRSVYLFCIPPGHEHHLLIKIANTEWIQTKYLGSFKRLVFKALPHFTFWLLFDFPKLK